MALAARAFVALQYLLPQHALTRAVHWLARRRTAWLRRALIRGFCALYAVDLAEAAEPDPGRYATFNDFFTRALAPGARPLAGGPRTLVSPCDGTVSERGRIDGERLLQARLVAKQRSYTLVELLGDAAVAAQFVGGEFATIYLAPHNYHRVHMPLAGQLRAVRYLPGRLFSVNAATVRLVPRLFARNERVVCLFDSAAGALAVVFVGALNVGSIGLVGFGDLTPARPRRARRVEVPAPALAFARGAELGRFNMGSTVILLLPAGSCRWAPGCTAGAQLRMGVAIGELTAHATQAGGDGLAARR
jgi:phosphatidylserine decarboxylase